jgi:NAD(P)-dependent dehydrogenase (short-subunit alcohol dehydrogenase family)
LDIQSFKDVDKAVESAVAEFGSVDILVNNASVPNAPHKRQLIGMKIMLIY